MRIQETAIPGVLIIHPDRHADERGVFIETYNRAAFREAGIASDFVQDNHVLSHSANVIRGLHFQIPPHAQGKLVRVANGAILDIAVDIRHRSPTFGQHVSTMLSAANNHMLWIPEGFAHGYCTLTPETVFLYKVTAPYTPESDRGLAWDDPALNIDWPVKSDSEAILSKRDRRNPLLSDLPVYFTF